MAQEHVILQSHLAHFENLASALTEIQQGSTFELVRENNLEFTDYQEEFQSNNMQKYYLQRIYEYVFYVLNFIFGIKKFVLWKIVYLPTLNQFLGRLTFVDILCTYFEEILKCYYKTWICIFSSQYITGITI